MVSIKPEQQKHLEEKGLGLQKARVIQHDKDSKCLLD